MSCSTVLLLLTCSVIVGFGRCTFSNICNNDDIGSFYGDQSTLPGYEVWPPLVDPTGGTDIQKWYKIGLNDCNSYLAKHREKLLATPTPKSFVAPTSIVGTVEGSTYACPVDHNCWFGILTCDGSPTDGSGSTHEAIKSQYFLDTSSYLKNYNKWKGTKFPNLPDKKYPTEKEHGSVYYHNSSYGSSSLSPRALHMNIRVSGDEVVTPYVRYTTMQHGGSLVDVLIANYTLTIPSSVPAFVEAKLIWFYPGKLFNFAPPVSPPESYRHVSSQSANVIPQRFYGENWDRMGSVFVGGSEYRCKPNGKCTAKNDCCFCDGRTQVENTPLVVSVPVSSAGGGSANPSGMPCSGSSPPNLPLCLNGNHQGRWIRLPSEVRELCDADDYMRQVQTEYRLGKYDTLSAIMANYEKAVLKDSGRVQESFQKLASAASKDSNTTRRGMYQELLRYTDGKNICMLMDISATSASLRTEAKDRLMIYAPYSCRYHVYSPTEAHAVLSASDRVNSGVRSELVTSISDVIFHGDSMSRDLFGVVNRLLGIFSFSGDKLKQQLNANIAKTPGHILQTQSQEVDWASCIPGMAMIPLLSRYVSLKTGAPIQAYIMNFALAHSIHEARTNDVDYDRMVYSSPAVKYWYDKLKTSKPSGANENPAPVFRIFQTGKEMQGMRNPYKEWTSENFAQMSNVLKHHYVEVLGFFELNEYILTTGRMDLVDGWHFGGNTKLMEGLVLLNILCNNK